MASVKPPTDTPGEDRGRAATTARPAGTRSGTGPFNDAVVLDAIRRSGGGISRAELAAHTGLATQTMSDICQRLLDQGLVEQTRSVSSGLGRPRRILELVPTSRYALGIHIDPATLTYVLLDLRGTLVARVGEETLAATEPEHVLSTMARTLDRLVTEAGVDRDRIVGLGIASPGPIDTVGGVVVDPPHLRDWHRVRLRDRLHAATGLPVTLGKDVTAAAVAERWAGAAVDSGDFVFLYLGTGIGLGAVTGGVVLRGSSGNAGDIGHLVVDVDGPPCRCGQRGCLGVCCSPLHLTREAVAAGVLPAGPADDDEIAAVRRLGLVCRAADDGDQRAVEILHRSARRLARAIDTLSGLLDAELVVLGGPAWTPVAAQYQPVLDRLAAGSAMRDIHGVCVVGTRLGTDVAAIGAACLALDETFAARAPTPPPT
jgi:predicted NBD/HSP70 family sugar kinase